MKDNVQEPERVMVNVKIAGCRADGITPLLESVRGFSMKGASSEEKLNFAYSIAARANLEKEVPIPDDLTIDQVEVQSVDRLAFALIFGVKDQLQLEL